MHPSDEQWRLWHIQTHGGDMAEAVAQLAVYKAMAAKAIRPSGVCDGS